ncbi:hypothetical protein IQ274_25750 [Nostoc sp. LEGE 12447]|uniref:hypothetical protein n=1 Tax=Nostoc sp. LEGE 12447 TaxID=1828640 RepID=UPI00188471CE|nr:hypothetical protein [Nostoc sp. LEGE 12447]MBE9001526.1 hypothetical protein [Nostoc sp. LEGE 12447]
MKRRYLASALSVIALFTSTTLNSANAVTFTPPINNGAPNQATGGASRGNFFIPASRDFQKINYSITNNDNHFRGE